MKIGVKGSRSESRRDGAAGAALDGDLARFHDGAPGGWRVPLGPRSGLAGVASGLLVPGRFRGSTSADRPPCAAAVRRKRPGR